MNSINWDMVGIIIAIVCLQAGILIAAAKSIFVTKTEYDEDAKEANLKYDENVKRFNSKLYDDKNITIFVTRDEWEKSKTERERRQDANQRAICSKMEGIQNAIKEMYNIQNETNQTISHLLGRFDQYLEEKD